MAASQTRAEERLRNAFQANGRIFVGCGDLDAWELSIAVCRILCHDEPTRVCEWRVGYKRWVATGAALTL